VGTNLGWLFKSANGPDFEVHVVEHVCVDRCDLFRVVWPSCKWARIGPSRIQEGHGVGS
jgi:hypothetical protein